MNNKKRDTMVLITVLVLLCALTACNSKPDTPDIANSDGADKAKAVEIMPGITEQQPQAFIVPSEQIGALGETIQAIDIQNGDVIPDALTYTVNKATIFADIAEAGIDESTMNPYVSPSLQDESGKLKPSVKFLLVELTVQNMRAEPERNITSFDILCADTATTSSDNAEASFFELFPSEPVYFSNPTGKRVGDDWKEYFNYKLPVGQIKDIKVGWYVDTEQFDPANLYLVFNRYQDEFTKFIKVID